MVVGVPEGVATRLDVIVTVITVLVVVGVTTRGVTTGGVTTGGMAVRSTKAASLTPSTGGNRGSTTTGLDALLKGELRGLERVRARNGDPGAWNGDPDPLPLSKLLISSSMEMVRSSQNEDNMAATLSSLPPPPSPLPPLSPSDEASLDWSAADRLLNRGQEEDCTSLEGLAGVVSEGPLCAFVVVAVVGGVVMGVAKLGSKAVPFSSYMEFLGLPTRLGEGLRVYFSSLLGGGGGCLLGNVEDLCRCWSPASLKSPDSCEGMYTDRRPPDDDDDEMVRSDEGAWRVGVASTAVVGGETSRVLTCAEGVWSWRTTMEFCLLLAKVS